MRLREAEFGSRSKVLLMWLWSCIMTMIKEGDGAVITGNLVQNPSATSGNTNSWTKESGDGCDIASESSIPMFVGPSDANVFNIKSCRMSQSVDVSYLSKYTSMGIVQLRGSGLFGSSSPDVGYLIIEQRTAAGASVVSTQLGPVVDAIETRDTVVAVDPRTRRIYIAFVSQQKGLGFNCDGWGTNFFVSLEYTTLSQSLSLGQGSVSSTYSDRGVSVSRSLTMDAMSTSKSSTMLDTFSFSSSLGVGSATWSSISPSLTFSPSIHSPSSSFSLLAPSSTVSHSPSTTLSPSPSASGSPSQSTSPSNTPSTNETWSATSLGSSSSSMSYSSTSTCTVPPTILVKITMPITDTSIDQTISSVTLCDAGQIARVAMPAVDLLNNNKFQISFWYSEDSQMGSWSVAYVNGTGVFEGIAFEIVSQDRNSLSGETTGIIDVAGGWKMSSRSPYVTQYGEWRWSLNCPLGGSVAATEWYTFQIVAHGATLPFSPVTSTTSTIAQALAQVSSGTLVPSTLSTMRALSRLASCGSNAVDSSYGVAAVTIGWVSSVTTEWSIDAQVVSGYALLVIIVSALVLVFGVTLFAVVGGSVDLSDVLARTHAPSLLVPVVSFSLPSIMGSGVYMFVGAEYPLLVGVAAIVATLLFYLWLLFVCALRCPTLLTVTRTPPVRIKTWSEVGQRVFAKVQSVVTWAVTRTFSWKPQLAGDVQHLRWKYAHHIIFQDVRFAWFPLIEIACSLATVAVASCVAQPGLGCQAATILLVVIYFLLFLACVIIRPYASPLIRMFAATVNALTVAAGLALAVVVFEIEYELPMRVSIAFQLLMLGLATFKGITDLIEFAEGCRRIILWAAEARRAYLSGHRSELILHFPDDSGTADSEEMMMFVNNDNGLLLDDTDPNAKSLRVETAQLPIATGYVRRAPSLDRASSHLSLNLQQSSDGSEDDGGEAATSEPKSHLPIPPPFALNYEWGDSNADQRWWAKRAEEDPLRRRRQDRKSLHGFTELMIATASSGIDADDLGIAIPQMEWGSEQ